MQRLQTKHQEKKKPLHEKLNPALLKPSAHRRVVFFRRCGKRKC